MDTVRTQRPQRKRRPKFLGRYELIGELARGGMGSVFLARHAGEAGFQRLFAIKILHENLAEEAAFVDMLRDEARIAARLHHPNVVPVVDIGTQGNEHYLVMDYVEGPSFATLWKRSVGKIRLDLVVTVIIETLEGLHYAHTLKDDDGKEIRLIHRDVSPPNILVGVDGITRITDFGIAKAESRIANTQPGTRKGKLQYMSPEQIKDSELIDRRADVWSVGVMLWNILTGEWLFKGDSDAVTAQSIMTKEVVPPSETEAKPPAFFDDIVLRALARDPDARFSSALEMAEALRKRATEHDMVGSRQDVAAWVENTFGDDLERRRAAIREVVRRRAAAPVLTEFSQVTMLPSLPSPVKIISPDDKASSASSQLPVLYPEPGTASGGWMGKIGKNPVWILAALVGAALVIALMLVLRAPSLPPIEATTLEIKRNPPQQPSAPPPPAVVAVQPDPPTPTGEARPSEPQAEPKPATKQTETETNTLSSGKDASVKSKHTSRKSRSVERAAAPFLSDSPTGDPQPAKPESNVPPKAPTHSTPTDDFETNPYLRR